MIKTQKAELHWLDNPEIFRVNQMAAHSDHIFYADKEELRQEKSSLYQSLNGDWLFRYSASPSQRPSDFYKQDFDVSSFDTIKVPCHIELAGYDNIHYINTMYPWEGHTYRRPACTLCSTDNKPGMFSQAEYNPVGSYRKNFNLDNALIGKRVCICFEGVEQAMYLWLNGKFIGYAEDSFTPSHFELTPYLNEKENILAIEVYKQSTAAFLEDQDFFRFFGIFRNVTLYAKPEIHLEDMWVKPVLLETNREGSFTLDMKFSDLAEGGYAKISLSDNDTGELFSETVSVTEQSSLSSKVISNVIPWEHKNPYLYTLIIEIYNASSCLLEVIPYRIGFRRMEIQNNIMLLNGKRLIINGVNRHEWNAVSGRCITLSDMREDISIFLTNHINAVRTSHYPNQIPWYSLCDSYGIYMMAETNLESHGSWQKMGAAEPSWNVPGSIPAWKEAVLDRAKTNFETFKNHTSILFWSLGNEAYAGDNIAAMNAFFKEKDTSRLVHYEGVFHNRIYEDRISDMESRMYATPAEIREYLSNSPKKPFLLCEYMHDMGNSLGGMQSYVRLLEEFEMYQGGFIWDFIDQALFVKDEITNNWVLRYGGDFDDRPSDYEFSGNGIVFGDRKEKPAMQEVKYYYGLYQ